MADGFKNFEVEGRKMHMSLSDFEKFCADQIRNADGPVGINKCNLQVIELMSNAVQLAREHADLLKQNEDLKK